MKDVIRQRTDWKRTYKDVRKKDITLTDVMERLEIMEVDARELSDRILWWRVLEGMWRSERDDFTRGNQRL